MFSGQAHGQFDSGNYSLRHGVIAPSKTPELLDFGRSLAEQLAKELSDVIASLERERTLEQLCASKLESFGSIPDLKLAPVTTMLRVVEDETRQYQTLLENCINLLQPKDGEPSDGDVISAVSLYLESRSKYYQQTNQKLSAGDNHVESEGGESRSTPRTMGRPQPPPPSGPPRGGGGSGRTAPLPAGGRGSPSTVSTPGPGAARAGVGRGGPMPGGATNISPRAAPPGAPQGRGGLQINPDLGKLINPGGPPPRPALNPAAAAVKQQDMRKRLSGASVQGSSSPQNLLRDLIISERDYVKSWSYVVNLLERVRREKIPERDEEIIFFKVETINSLHRELLVALEEALNNWPNKLIGALFLRRVLTFKVYVAYVTNRTLQKDQLENLKASSKTFAAVLRTWEKDTEKDLSELLDMPEKRIVSYEQFLMKMVIGTDDKDPDYQYLSQAQKEYLTIKSDAAKSFKTGLRIEEQIKFRKQLQLASEEFIIDPKRRLIREGPLKSLNNDKGKDMDYFFLYSDMLLCTKRIGATQYRFIRKIPLKNALLEKKVPMPKGGFYPGTFRLHMDKTTSFIFATEHKQEFHEWIVAVKKALNEARSNQIFGVSLKIMSDYERKKTGNNVPWIAEEASEFIMSNCALQEGIFRLAGSAVEIDKLKDLIQEGERFSFEEMSKTVDENVLADIFKYWIRELPDPLLTYGLYNEWIQAASIDDENRYQETLKVLVNKLPVDNRYLLQVVIKCLKKIVDHSDVNKMTVNNISIIFGPNIMKRRNAPLVDPDSRVILKICGDLIQNYELLFTNVEQARLHEKEGGQKLVQEAQDQERRRVEYLSTVPLDRKEKLVPHSTIAIPEGEIIKLGQLMKRGAHARSSFKGRWFVLKYKQLAYFKSRSEMNKAPQGVIELKDCCVDVMEGDHKEGAKFLVLKESRCYEIAASSEKERDEWMSAINSCIENRVVRTPSEIMEREEKAAGGFLFFKGL